MRMIVILCALFKVSVSLDLKYFETITTIEESSYMKRDATGVELNKQLSFNFQNRRFHVSLKSGTSVLAQQFKSYLVQEGGRTEEFLFDQSNVYSGHLFDNTSVFVNAYKAEELWSIHIFADDDTYAVEPAYNLLSKDKNPFNHSMFAYRASDIVESGGKCGVKNSPIFEGGHAFKYKVDKPENLMKGNGSRKTRSTDGSNTCLLHVVGDYDFFKYRCNSNYVKCSSLMVSFINFADSIYKSSNFVDSDNNPMGLLRIQIARLDLYQTNTKSSGDFEMPHFNVIKNDWASDTKLSVNNVENVQSKSISIRTFFRRTVFTCCPKDFSAMFRIKTKQSPEVINALLARIRERLLSIIKASKEFGIILATLHDNRSFAYSMSFLSQAYCHHHLFTQFPMPERVLGLSYISAVCYVTAPRRLRYNTGITSGEDSSTGGISSLQMNLVFVHELGHNLGSEHDPATDECSHPDEKGGDYIMWDRAVSGKHPNHKKFSPCSLRHIGSAMKKYACFTSYKTTDSFCGNGIVDMGEECDSGFQTSNECCNSYCQLNKGAMCSETNKQCCVDCKIASSTTVCSDTGKADCRQKSFCTGHSYDCPASDIVPDWTDCIDGGVCYQGKCLSYCEMKSIFEKVDLQPCLCRDVENACKWCCYDVSDKDKPGICQPYIRNESLKDGRPCYLGFCKDGICKPHVTSSIKRIASFLKTIEVTALAKFMKTNIVSTVVVLTLLVWTPCVLLIGTWDRRVREEYEMEQRLKALARNHPGTRI